MVDATHPERPSPTRLQRAALGLLRLFGWDTVLR